MVGLLAFKEVLKGVISRFSMLRGLCHFLQVSQSLPAPQSQNQLSTIIIRKETYKMFADRYL